MKYHMDIKEKNNAGHFTAQAAAVFAAELPLLFLFLSVNKLRFYVELTVYVFICVSIIFLSIKNNVIQNIREIFCLNYPVQDILLCTFAAARFYRRWFAYFLGRSFFEMSSLSLQQKCVILTAIAAVAAIPSVDLIARTIASIFPVGRCAVKTNRRNKVFSLFFVFLTSVVFITLNSECSPLYPTNNWNDANIMFTVGKSVLKGFVPYKDYLDQKGPICLFLHTIGAAVSYDSFIGMWLLEIAAAFLCLYIVYRTVSLYSGKIALWCVPLFAAAAYGCVAFEMGDSAEEYCLPLIAYAFYLGLKSINSDRLPSKREFFFLGLTSGCVFWIKYSMLGFYAAWFLFFLFFSTKKKLSTEFFAGCGIIAGGVTVVTAPVLIYFAANSAIPDLFKAYFFNIIVYYAGSDFSFIGKMKEGFLIFMEFNCMAMIFPIAGVILFAVQKRTKEAVFVFFVFLSDFVITYSGGRFIAYYSLIFCVFSISFFCGIACLTEKMKSTPILSSGYAVLISILSLSFSVVLLSIFSINMMHINENKNNFLAYKLKNVIDEYSLHDPKILHYKTMETGVNTVTGALPNVKHFSSYNMDELPDQHIEQEACIDTGCADFIVMDSDHLLDEENVPVFELYDYLGFFQGSTRTTAGTYFYHYYTRK